MRESPRPRNKGNRTEPGPSNHAYALLTQLRAKLEEVMQSERRLEGGRVLDLGCGTRPYECLLRKRFGEYVGADLLGNTHADVVIGPGPLPFRSASFDCVFSTQVLEHVRDPHFYLQEANRVLKVGGTLLLSTHGIWWYHPHPGDYWRWTADGLTLELAKAGLTVAQCSGVLCGPAAAIQLWQDTTSGALPGPFKHVYHWLLQRCIGLVGRLYGGRPIRDAAVWVVVAHKEDIEPAV